MGAVTYAYNRALVDRGDSYYPLFWMGLAAILGSAMTFVLARSRTRTERLVVLVGAAGLAFVPKVLMSMSGPRYYDEFFHLRQAADTVAAGKLFLPNPGLPVVRFYPGLSAVTTVIHDLSGLSLWRSGQLIVLVAHVVTVLAIFLIAEGIWRDDRVAAVAALLYAVGPSFIYFDSQYGYESLALPFLAATVFCAVSIRRAGTNAEARSFAVVGALLGVGCILTHHLTAIALAIVLAVLAVASLLRDRSRPVRAARYTGALAVMVAAAVAGWIGTYARPTIAYLSPYPRQALSELTGHSSTPTVIFIDGATRRVISPSHALFSQSSAPGYEKAAGFAAPALLALAFAVTALMLIRRRRWPSGLGPFLVLGGLYFASLPFTLVAAGGEGAHRSWAYTYLGVVLVVAGGGTWVLDRHVRHGRRTLVVVAAGLVAALAVVTLGSQAVSEDTDYRFPGPYQFESDTLGVTPELRATSAWFLATYGPGHNLLTDRTSGEVLISSGRQDPVPYVSEVNYLPFATVGLLPRSLVRTLANDGDDFMVVDKRIERLVGKHAPLGPAVQPIDPANLNRYRSLPWVQLVYESTNYAVYHFDFGALAASGFAGTKS